VKLYALSTMPHWIDHLAPIWKALDPEEQGVFWTSPSHNAYARSLGIKAINFPAWDRPSRSDISLVASEADRARMMPYQVVRFEHGIGGSFHGGPPLPEHPIPGRPNLAIAAQRNNASYAGGDRQRNVIAFLNPNHYANDWWKRAYPFTTCEIIGSPRMDEFHLRSPKPRSNPPVVAISFHFDATIVPESRSAFPHFRDAVAELAARKDITLIGHSHPKYRTVLSPFYADHQVEYVPDFAEVVARADAYAVDSFSTLYEFASLDRPVVVMNAPFFRRDVHHGLRFWEYSDIGPVANEPEELSSSVDLALEDCPEMKERRRVASVELYPYRGAATARAVEVLRRVRDEREGVSP